MKLRMKKILSLALAFTMVVSVPNADMLVKAETAGNVTVTAPTLPDGFSEALEDNDGLTLATGTSASENAQMGTVIDVTTHWDNKNSYHASVNDVSVFKSGAFTVLLNVRQDAPTSDTNRVDQRVAFSVGNNSNSIHLLSYSGKLGYGADVAGSGGVSQNLVDLSGVVQNDWNAVAMTYEEVDGANGHVVVYVNGQKAADVADIGFKLSEQSDLTAMIARCFNTNYLQQGRYDNIVVGNTVLDEATAIAETAYRLYTIENPTTFDYEKITIKAADVEKAVANKNGLTYKGFGMLNGNSTSNLLLDYKTSAPEKYNEMMEYLFGGENPLFTHIKMEMGNDGNNSTGAEACTMRYENEEADVSRSPGFVMVADAKAINPDVKVSFLRWCMPNWVKSKWNSDRTGAGYEAMYKWYSETIFDAYEKYGYVVDMVNPDVNETGDPDEAFIKWFENKVSTETNFPSYFTDEAKAAYNNIRIIASDENKGLKIVPSMRADAELYDAVDIIGFHYRTSATADYVKMADVDDKEVWYSEGCATFGYSELQENKTSTYGYESIGGYQSPLALVDSFITAFEASRRTHYMFQPAIGSFYEGIQYGHKELLSARDPWSGYIHYDPALYMIGHFSKFAKTGWEDSDPSGDDIWRAIAGATKASFAGTDNEHATAGINGNAGYMTLAAPDMKDFSVVFVNNTQNKKYFAIDEDGLDVADDAVLNYWVTETDNYMQNKGSIEKTAEGWIVELPPYCVATATTLSVDEDELRAPVDDIHNEDRAVLDTDEDGKVNGVTNDTTLYADDFDYDEYSDLKVTYNGKDYDYITSRGNEPRYMLDTHSAWLVEDGKLKQELSSSVDQWNGGEPSTIVGDFRWMDYVASVDATIPKGTARLTIRSQSGMNWNNSGYTFCLSNNGAWELYRIGTSVASGKIETTADNTYNIKLMGCGNVVSAVVNGEAVTSYTDAVPMLSGRVKISSTWDQMYFDNLKVETVAGGMPYATAMVDGQDDCVNYTGTWAIEQPGGGSADNWYRTLSVTSTADSAFEFPVDGTGFAVTGTNDGSAVLDVYVDGELVAENAKTVAAPIRGEAYVYGGLEDKEHTVKVVVKSGKLQIDAIHTLGEKLVGSEDVLVSADTTNAVVLLGADIKKLLPEKVNVTTAAGTVVEKSVVWNTENVDLKAFGTGVFVGTVQDGVNALGLPLMVSVTVDVLPANLDYFIDMAETNPASITTTEPYETMKAFYGDKLLNQVYDQMKTDDTTWGRIDTDATGVGHTGTTDKDATGIYAKENKAGETLSYAFTLPAGKYTITSQHEEWWPGWNDRPMKVTISYGDTEINAGSIGLKGSNSSVLSVTHVSEFELENEELVTYTLTSTGSEAPVISWLAVSHEGAEEEVHTHTYVYTDNGNGTHTGACACGEKEAAAAHTYVNGVCSACGAKEEKKEVVEVKAEITAVENAKKGLTVTWNAVPDAKSYTVYRQTGKKMEAVSTTTATSLTDKKANKNGTKYQYKVEVTKADGTKVETPVVTAYRLTAVKLSSAKNAKGKKITAKYAKNKKANGYEIAYATDKNFSDIKTVDGKKKTSVTIKKLAKGKTYFVKVRAYKKSGGVKYYSAWSNAKKVKVKK